MNKYRVKFVDDVQGKVFTFAVYYEAKGLFHTERQANEEFPTADILNIELTK
jgi:hypothetical protein